MAGLSRKTLFFCFLIPICIYGLNNSYMITGEGKLRFRYVAADQDQITGSYGEELKQGLGMRQRIDLTLDYFLTDYLTIGGTIRISNEEFDGVLPPPDLISTRAIAGWWSANLYKPPIDVTLGAYDASFTPLTLMRWDENDNPLGATGCGCQIAIGGISGESMEELEEDYLLEGAHARYENKFGDISILYARPEVDIETESFTRHMVGGHARIVLPYTRNFSTLTIGITGLRVVDDTQSVSMALYDPIQSDVFGVDINLPLIWRISAVAEYARSIRDDNLFSDVDIIREENGFIAGVRLKSGDRIDLNVLYLQLDPYFSPLYRALSYAKNRQGFRGSFTVRKIPLMSHLLAFSLYGKVLREIKPTWNEAITEWHSSLTDHIISNAALSYTMFEQWKAEGSYEFRMQQRDDDAMTLADEALDLMTHVISGGLTYEFTFQTKIVLKYQYIKHVDGIGQDSYQAHMPSVQFSFKF